MRQIDGFVPAGEVVADERARLSFGKAGVRRDDRYAVAVNDDGEILLTPLVSIPKRELFIWENQLAREELGAGLKQAAVGDLVDLGSFAQFVGEEVVDDDADVEQ